MFNRKEKIVTDEQLMQQLSAGNQQAFNTLYNRYNNRLYYFFYRMLDNSSESANDFLQELFLKIIDNPNRFNANYSFASWVFAVAHNMCKNEYRRREKHKISPHLTEQIAEELLATQEISNEAIVERIYDYLNQLGEEHRTVFLLHYREGFGIKEIAKLTNNPPGTIKSRLFYTRKCLASKFDYLKDEIEF